MSNTPVLPEDTLQLLHQTVSQFEQQMETINQRGQQIAKVTLSIIRTVLFILAISVIFIFVLIAQLSGDMRGVVSNMIEMYERFGTMSQDVDIMTNSVKSINRNMEGMPTIAARMQHMSQTVGGMQRDVGGMTRNISTIDTQMVAISQGVADMSGRFEHLTHTVGRMNYNVHQMSGPLRMFP